MGLKCNDGSEYPAIVVDEDTQAPKGTWFLWANEAYIIANDRRCWTRPFNKSGISGGPAILKHLNHRYDFGTITLAGDPII